MTKASAHPIRITLFALAVIGLSLLASPRALAAPHGRADANGGPTCGASMQRSMATEYTNSHTSPRTSPRTATPSPHAGTQLELALYEKPTSGIVVRGQPTPAIFHPLPVLLMTAPMTKLNVEQALRSQNGGSHYVINITQYNHGTWMHRDLRQSNPGAYQSYENAGALNMIDLTIRYPRWAAQYGIEYKDNQIIVPDPKALNLILDNKKNARYKRVLRFDTSFSMLELTRKRFSIFRASTESEDQPEVTFEGLVKNPVHGPAFLSHHLGASTIAALAIPENVVEAYLSRLEFYEQMKDSFVVNFLSPQKKKRAKEILSQSNRRNIWGPLTQDFAQQLDLAIHHFHDVDTMSTTTDQLALTALRRLLSLYYLLGAGETPGQMGAQYTLPSLWHSSPEHLKSQLISEGIWNTDIAIEFDSLTSGFFSKLSPAVINDDFRMTMREFFYARPGLIELAIRLGPL